MSDKEKDTKRLTKSEVEFIPTDEAVRIALHVWKKHAKTFERLADK